MLQIYENNRFIVSYLFFFELLVIKSVKRLNFAAQ